MNYAARCHIISLVSILLGVYILVGGMFSGSFAQFLLNFIIYCVALFDVMLYGYNAEVWLQEQEEKAHAISAERAKKQHEKWSGSW